MVPVMLIRLALPDDVDVPPVGAVVPLAIGDQVGIATVAAVSTAGGRSVATMVVPEWVADHLGVGAPVLPVDVSGRAHWHQTRTAHGALPASAYA
jgi:hypothetical protein